MSSSECRLGPQNLSGCSYSGSTPTPNFGCCRIFSGSKTAKRFHLSEEIKHGGSMYDQLGIAATKLRSRRISNREFANLLGISTATVSQWFNYKTIPSQSQLQQIKDTVAGIEQLFNKLSPIRPDLSDPENARLILDRMKQKRLYIAIHEPDDEELVNLAKDEIEQSRLTRESMAMRALCGQLMPDDLKSLPESNEVMENEQAFVRAT